MGNTTRKEIEAIEQEISQRKVDLERLEDRFVTERRQVDEALFELEDTYKELQTFYESAFDEAYSRIRSVDGDTFKEMLGLNALIESYAVTTEQVYGQERRLLEEKSETLHDDFYQAKGHLEQDMERCLSRRKQLLWQ